ncbi:MAG: hypothetical protein Kow0097_01650 [Candidatus Bipolaricaulota bacterium]
MALPAAGRRLLAGPLGTPAVLLAAEILRGPRTRRYLLTRVERRLRERLAHPPVPPPWRARDRERTLLALGALRSLDRTLARGTLSPHVLRAIVPLWGRAGLVANRETRQGRRFAREHRAPPPWFLVLAPTQACNLRCPDCYAAAGANVHLPWPILDRVLAEARERWDARLVVLSGGEPLLYGSEGHDVLDLVARHRRFLYLMFTNGTLITPEVAQKLAVLGNLTPAISVEGDEEETDRRRGKGTFRRIQQAMAYLRTHGVPFGISVTVTRDNVGAVLSDAFLDLFFEEEGAFYGFLFHYMPIGRGPEVSQMITPQERVELWRRSWDTVEKRGIFLFDFWNSGPVVQGCLAAGREGGYLYIDWNGDVFPCVFVPYRGANVVEAYARGETLDEVWEAPLFARLRDWQRGYGYGAPTPARDGDWLRPCPMRDHHAELRELLHGLPDNSLPVPDPDVAAALDAFDAELATLTTPIWRERYLGGGGSQAEDRVRTVAP